MNIQEHLLVIVMEECAEVQLAISKMLRFGWDDHHPDNPGTTNIADVRKEILDLIAVLEMVESDAKMSLVPNHSKHREQIAAKKSRVYDRMEYSRHKGLLDNA